jgi:amidohydrolase
MPIVNRVAEFAADVKGWRHDLHAHPELLYEVHRTAAFVAEKLRGFGCDEVVTGIGRTGVVGVIRGRGKGAHTIALRADMDALPIIEATGADYASTIPGKMHACGHDGHMSMLLGAARYLAETRNFSGTAVVVFQPAEEGGAGAKAMIDDGLVKRFGIEQFYGMHNLPGLAAGEFAMRVGPIMAATDNFDIEIEGSGGHAARPHLTVDPIVIGAQLINALQAVVSRNVDPLESAVVSVCHFEAGHTHNVIAPRALLQGTSRSLTEDVRAILEHRIRDIVDGIARQHGVPIKLDYQRGYPVTINHADETHLAERIAADVAGSTRVHATPPLMAGEDFSYMLREKPGAFIFVGNGDSSGLHTPGYDFNDDVLPVGMSYWIRLVETALPA